MTLKQKANIQRLLGNIEGISYACEENIKLAILGSLYAIDEILRKNDWEWQVINKLLYQLQHIHDRLVLNYNDNIPFEQLEEDRFVIANVIEILEGDTK